MNMKNFIVGSVAVAIALATGGCVPLLAVSALSALAGGPQANAPKQNGPMAEPVGQKIVQDALSMLNDRPHPRCLAALADRKAEAQAAETVPDPAPRAGGCAEREVCLAGFDAPVEMRVCDPSAVAGAGESGTAPAGQNRPAADMWSWDTRPTISDHDGSVTDIDE